MITHQNSKVHNPSRVIALGANGFIGREILKNFEINNIPFIAPNSKEINLAEDSSCDRLVSLLQPTDTVVMLAALTPDKGRDIKTMMNNLAMMENLCAALKKTSCAHLIYFSSDAVYNNGVSRVNEDLPASPQDLYGVMHYAREIMAHSLLEIPVLVLRPTIVYGVNDTHNSYGPNRFRRMAHKDGKITLFGSGEEMTISMWKTLLIS
jgi:UDP-glucose 4-epimerase